MPRDFQLWVVEVPRRIFFRSFRKGDSLMSAALDKNLGQMPSRRFITAQIRRKFSSGNKSRKWFSSASHFTMLALRKVKHKNTVLLRFRSAPVERLGPRSSAWTEAALSRRVRIAREAAALIFSVSTRPVVQPMMHMLKLISGFCVK